MWFVIEDKEAIRKYFSDWDVRPDDEIINMCDYVVINQSVCNYEDVEVRFVVDGEHILVDVCRW